MNTVAMFIVLIRFFSVTLICGSVALILTAYGCLCINDSVESTIRFVCPRAGKIERQCSTVRTTASEIAYINPETTSELFDVWKQVKHEEVQAQYGILAALLLLCLINVASMCYRLGSKSADSAKLEIVLLGVCVAVLLTAAGAEFWMGSGNGFKLEYQGVTLILIGWHGAGVLAVAAAISCIGDIVYTVRFCNIQNRSVRPAEIQAQNALALVTHGLQVCAGPVSTISTRPTDTDRKVTFSGRGSRRISQTPSNTSNRLQSESTEWLRQPTNSGSTRPVSSASEQSNPENKSRSKLRNSKMSLPEDLEQSKPPAGWFKRPEKSKKDSIDSDVSIINNGSKALHRQDRMAVRSRQISSNIRENREDGYDDGSSNLSPSPVGSVDHAAVENETSRL